MGRQTVLLLGALALLLIPLAGYNKKKEAKTVDWYMAPWNLL